MFCVTLNIFCFLIIKVGYPCSSTVFNNIDIYKLITPNTPRLDLRLRYPCHSSACGLATPPIQNSLTHTSIPSTPLLYG